MTKTGINGSATFPVNSNDIYGLIETIASQNIKGLKSVNRIVDGFYEYDVENGVVIEEAVIEMASAQAFDKTGPNFSPTDPSVKARYFNNFEPKQFKTTVRRDDIRKIIANKGVGVEDVVSVILDTLSQGEGNYDFLQCRNALYNAGFKNYREILGGVPKNMKGVIYALRDMYNHLKCNNSDLTDYEYISATPEADIMIAVSPKLMNLINVVELANIFNLSKEEIFGKMVIVDVDDLTGNTYDYYAFVYDRKALGRATRLFDYSQDIIGSARYTNHYLTVERAYFHNGLFKGAYLDCSEACATEKATIVDTPTSYSVTKTLTHATTTSTVASVYRNEAYQATFTAGTGYTLDDDSAVATVTMGGTSIEAITVSVDGKSCVVNVPHVTGNLVVTVTAVAE